MPVRERMLGSVQIVLLHLIEKNVARYGESLREELTKLFGEHVADAQVYVALNRLYERGLLLEGGVQHTGRKGKPRKLYRISPEGSEALDQYRTIASYILLKTEPAH